MHFFGGDMVPYHNISDRNILGYRCTSVVLKLSALQTSHCVCLCTQTHAHSLTNMYVCASMQTQTFRKIKTKVVRSRLSKF